MQVWLTTDKTHQHYHGDGFEGDNISHFSCGDKNAWRKQCKGGGLRWAPRLRGHSPYGSRSRRRLVHTASAVRKQRWMLALSSLSPCYPLTFKVGLPTSINPNWPCLEAGLPGDSRIYQADNQYRTSRRQSTSFNRLQTQDRFIVSLGKHLDSFPSLLPRPLYVGCDSILSRKLVF